MKNFFRIAAGISGVSAFYILVAGILHAAFGWNFMLKIGYGGSYIDLPEDTAGIFFAFFAVTLMFLIFWFFAKFDEAVSWMKSHKVPASFMVLGVVAAIVGTIFWIQQSLNNDFFNLVRNGDFLAVEKLLASGKNVNEPDPDRAGQTALMDAATWYPVETVSFLLGHGADANAMNRDGMTALLSAVSFRSTGEEDTLKVVQALVAGGARVDTKDPTGKTAFDLASEMGYSTIAAFLKR